MTTENITTSTKVTRANKTNSATRDNDGKQQRVVSSPNDVASLVLAQLNHVNSKKDDLTIAIKGLADTTQQLVRIYADHTRTIQKLAERVKALEGKTENEKE